MMNVVVMMMMVMMMKVMMIMIMQFFSGRVFSGTSIALQCISSGIPEPEVCNKNYFEPKTMKKFEKVLKSKSCYTTLQIGTLELK